ncbi:MAG TPA: polyprenyl synthetase family protein, partial [Spirochaetia bacterium]|nr:polyprenyl synthetase family protein [Spirochaetia bacterium]
MVAMQTKGAFTASLTEHKREISAILDAFFAARRRDLSEVNQLANEACDRLRQFVLAGKMIRGGLVTVGLSLCRDGPSSRELHMAHQVGAAIELFQSGLLIHDDIMDRDLMRRGRATLFEQYSRDARQGGVNDWRHLGEALGTCVGDVAFFLGYELLGGLSPSPAALGRIIALFSRELAAVGIAQMQDVAWGADPSAQPGTDDILRLYRFKTGRYSFSLPLAAGAILAGAADSSIEALEALGECVGVIFQIRDDELGLWGDEKKTGKPVGSDIREGKKTLL